MKRIIVSVIFVWFLVIQYGSVDNSFAYSIPMQNENYCVKAIEAIRLKVKDEYWKGFLIPQYNCVEAGDVL